MARLHSADVDGEYRPSSESHSGEVHGTRSRYRKGCQCDDCRRAERTYRRAYRQRRRAS